MYIHPWSALFGALIAGAIFVLTYKVYTRFLGGKELRKLKKENRQLKSDLDEKDKYIRKSLDELKKQTDKPEI